MYAWGKKGKMLVFKGVYVCVKAKLTLVSFFFFFFFAPFPYDNDSGGGHDKTDTNELLIRYLI